MCTFNILTVEPQTNNLRKLRLNIINRSGVARVVLQTPIYLIYSSSDPFPPNLQNTWKTVRARKQKLLENVQPRPCVTCHVSCVTCHMSHVICHMSCVKCFFFFFFFFYKMVALVCEGSVINKAYPV